MKTRLVVIALVLATLFVASSCTAAEIGVYLDSTKPTRHVLSNAQLARLRACESNGDYTVTSSSGTYRGAYQFNRSTWNAVAGRHFPWLVGRDPAAVESWWQDAMARALWSERGAQPWPHCGKRV